MKIEKSEAKFIDANFYNKGFSFDVQAVTRCLFISLEAKKVYTSLAHYCYGNKRECNPSQGRLALELRTSRQRINKYIDELREKGLIYATYNPDSSLTYYLKKLDTTSIIRHSEIVWKSLDNIRDTLKTPIDDKLEKVLKQYEKSELFAKVDLSDEPERYKDLIYEWFANMISKNGIRANPQRDKSKMDILENLLNYFYEKYLELKGEPMTPSIQDRTADIESLRRAYKRCNYEFEELKKRIDIFYNSHTVKYHNTKVFAQEITQRHLQLASKNNQDYIVIGVSHEKIDLFGNSRKPEAIINTDFSDLE